MKIRLILLFTATLLTTHRAAGEGLSDFLKRNSSRETVPSLANLSQDQIVAGLKEALGDGMKKAIASLGRPDGFLGDLGVKIPMPENLQKIERGLRAIGQDKYADQFVITMNRAAEQAVPEAAAVLGESVKQMSIADAKSVLTGPNNAATDYFRRTSGNAIRDRLLPIVKAATEKAGVTSAYKQMAEKAGGLMGSLGGSNSLNRLGGFGGLAKMPDLDAYITEKALDGLFLKIAEQEKLIRANPVARTTDLLKKVFGAAAKAADR